ncbi:hypothetical protein E4U21_002090 [Claviceps maximensis]|nr:hypothetical protein E4U21_002090 [Claviceps maximensis]
MAMALELHREIDAQVQVTPSERELRRRLFWTCYLLDRYHACGSKRAPLINDDCIALRLPSWSCSSPSSSLLPSPDGEFFQQDSDLQYCQGSVKRWQGSLGMLVDITRILGRTNRYVAAGGVKGDSHFPWHSFSALSKIQQELDFWASGAFKPTLEDLNALFRQSEPTIVFLSKLIYHLIHCLLYRPFLPVELAELAAGDIQYQSWQIEATNLCFIHANAIGELVEAARQQAGTVELPAIVGYCICAAATVHIHGAHYTIRSGSVYGGDVNIFAPSSGFLSRELESLENLHSAWANVRHQSDTLKGIYVAHGELIQAMTSSHPDSLPMAMHMAVRGTPEFHLEDFFDRYLNIGGPGGNSYRFDTSYLSMLDVVVNVTAARYGESPDGRDDLAGRRHSSASQRLGHKRKSTAFFHYEKQHDIESLHSQEQQQRQLTPLLGGHVSTHSHANEASYSPNSIQSIHPHQHPHQHQQQHRHQQQHQQQQHQQHQIQTSQTPRHPSRASAVALPHAHYNFGTTIATNDPSRNLQRYSATIPLGNVEPNHGALPMAALTAAGPSPSPSINFAHSLGFTPASAQNNTHDGQTHHHDPTFGPLSSHDTFSGSGSEAWKTGEGAQHKENMSRRGTEPGPSCQNAVGGGGGGEVGDGSASASAILGTSQNDEKDPFLSLLEQLAENHGQRFHGDKGGGLELFFGRE